MRVNILHETIMFLHLLGRCCEQVRGVVHLVDGVDHLLLHPAADQHVPGLVSVKAVAVGLPRAQHCHTEHFRISKTNTPNTLKLQTANRLSWIVTPKKYISIIIISFHFFGM